MKSSGSRCQPAAPDFNRQRRISTGSAGFQPAIDTDYIPVLQLDCLRNVLRSAHDTQTFAPAFSKMPAARPCWEL